MKIRPGVSMVEALLAVVVFGAFVTAFTSAMVYAPQITADGGQRVAANNVLEESFSALNVIKQLDWSDLSPMTSGLELVGNQWSLKGDGTTDTTDGYTRSITLSEVCRTEADAITDCPGDYTDPNTYLATVTVDWTGRYGLARTSTAKQYFTNWQSNAFTQDNWIGGDGQAVWSDETKFDSTDDNLDVTTANQVTLAETTGSASGAGCGAKSYPFTTAGDYTYGSDITVSGGAATLTAYGTAVDANTMGLWHLNQSATPLTDSSGRNNNLTQTGTGHVYGATGKFATGVGSSDGSGDYWQIADTSQSGLESMTALTLEAWYKTGSSVNAGLDRIVGKYNTTLATRSYGLFWNNGVNGSANIQFGLGNGVTEVTLTSSQFAIAANTWYHLAAVYDGSEMRVYLNGTNVGSRSFSGTVANSSTAFAISWTTTNTPPVGAVIDEVRVSNNARYTSNFTPATLPFGISYATTSPTITNAVSYDPLVVDRWQAFAETATKSGTAEIYYQLSDDDGATWQYWNGSAWATASTSTNYNTAAIINTNIATFPTTNGKLKWKAFFVSNGEDSISLDAITLTCIRVNTWDFATPASYTTATGTEVSSGSARLSSSGTAPDANTVGLWHFNESAGPFLDYSVSNNSMVNGSLTAAQTGQFSYAVAGTTSSSYAYLPYFTAQTNLDLSNTDFTIDFWIYKTTGSVTSDIIKKWSGTTAGNGFHVYVNTSNKVLFEVANGSGTSATLFSNTALSLNTWTHVAVVFDRLPTTDGSGYNSYMYMYINGVYDNHRPTIYTTLSNPAADIIIGATSSTSIRGRLDELRISNSARWTVTSGIAFTVPTLPYGLSYATTSPTVQNTAAATLNTPSTFYGFAESKTVQNAATITYQLSNDGTNWKYWNGSAWAAATTSSHTNAASVINTNVGSFTTTGNTIYFKAFFNSNGADSASLENLEITYVQDPEATVTEGSGGPAGFEASGYLISSAYDMGANSVINSIDWDEVLPSDCDPIEDCDVKLQIRTAPDDAGAPGTWTSWYGPTAVDTYFDTPTGTATPAALNNKRWLQYRLELTSDSVVAPLVNAIRIRYQ